MISDLLSKPWVKTGMVLGASGFAISFVIVLFSGGDYFPALVLRPLASAIVMASFGVGAYFLVQNFSPELLKDVFGNSQRSEDRDYTNEESPDLKDEFDFDLDKQDISPDVRSSVAVDETLKIKPNPKSEQETSQKASPQTKSQARVGSDEMLVEGIPLKKDPELMAKAIQHVLDTDKD
ncbi:MAG: hypothetical protein OEV66_11375 [Spirochaetia bacterium]|nr:hypothetical protein [Spirochaetia bacterium]